MVRENDSGDGVVMTVRVQGKAEDERSGGEGLWLKNACGFQRYLPDCLVTVSQL